MPDEPRALEVSELDRLRWDNLRLDVEVHRLAFLVQQQEWAASFAVRRAELDRIWRDAYGVGIDGVTRTPEGAFLVALPPVSPQGATVEGA